LCGYRLNGGDLIRRQDLRVRRQRLDLVEVRATLSVTLGGAPEDLDLLKRNRDLGVARMNVRLPSGKADEILALLDRWAKLIAAQALNPPRCCSLRVAVRSADPT
jgi:hypothetical protein